jgi:Domain of unknown function DUF29
LSRRERDTVGSHLETVLERLLKLELSNAGRPRRGWLVTADKQQAKLARKLTTTARTDLEAELPALYGGLQRPVAGQLEKAGVPRSLPPAGPHTLEPVLDSDWFPKNVHGIEDPVF